MPDEKNTGEQQWLEVYVCPMCSEQQPGPEEGPMDLTQPDDERDDEGYLICDGYEEHEPVRFAPVKAVPLACIRERLQRLLDGEDHLYEAAKRTDDYDGMVSHGGAREALRDALLAFPEEQ